MNGRRCRRPAPPLPATMRPARVRSTCCTPCWCAAAGWRRHWTACPRPSRGTVRPPTGWLPPCCAGPGRWTRSLEPFLRRAPPDAVRQVLRIGAAQLLLLDTPAHAAVATAVALARSRGLGAVHRAGERRAAPGRGGGAAALAALDGPRGWTRRTGCGPAGARTPGRSPPPTRRRRSLDLTVTGAARRRAAPCCRPAPSASPRAPASPNCPATRTAPSGCRTRRPPCPPACWRAQPGEVGRRFVRGAGRQGGAARRQPAPRCTAVERDARRIDAAAREPASARAWPRRSCRPTRRPGDRRPRWTPCCWTRRAAPPARSAAIPDVPHLKSPEDVARSTVQQRALIAAAAAMLRPGGRLVYAVCSLQPQEGRERDAGGRSGRLAARPVRTADGSGDDARSADAGRMPAHASRDVAADRGGMDGFFAVRFVKP